LLLFNLIVIVSKSLDSNCNGDKAVKAALKIMCVEMNTLENRRSDSNTRL